MLIGTALVALALSALLTGAVRRYSLARSVLDVPNERSLHSLPTPRGGGLAIAICWLVALPVLWAVGWLDGPVAIGLWGGSVVLAAVGWRDDQGGLPALARGLLHLVAAAWLVGWLGGVPEVDLGSATVRLGWSGSVLATLGVVWLTNLYNFMDGIDGLAGVQAVAAGGISAVVLGAAGAPGLAAAAAILAGAAGGFLAWNWPPARIFMGDVGSGTVGFAFAGLVLGGERAAGVPLPILLLPLGVFICDATYTLVRRLLRGERVYAAHRSHVYQRLVQAGWSHLRVTSTATLVSLALAGLAWGAWLNPARALWAVAVAIVGLSLLAALLLRIAGATRPPAM